MTVASLNECLYLASIYRGHCQNDATLFRDWCERRGYQYETARKLARIGDAPNPAIALEQSRASNKTRNRELRERERWNKGKEV